MKIQTLLIAGALALSLTTVRTVFADDAVAPTPRKTPAVEVPRSGNEQSYKRALENENVPKEIKTLVSNFATTRDAYLADQKQMLGTLKDAAAADREKIREALQKNRADFLADLRTFRETLKQELQELKGKINHQEFNRVVEAARDTAADRPGRKGQR